MIDNQNRTAKGFVWRTKGNKYKGELAKAPPPSRAQKVSQYDMKGKKLGVYNSTKEAEHSSGASASSISMVARGKLKSTGGFIWAYGDGPAKIDTEKHYASTTAYINSISKPVLKYSLEGELLKEYPSIAAAAREEGISLTSISAVINGQRKSAGGDYWKLKT